MTDCCVRDIKSTIKYEYVAAEYCDICHSSQGTETIHGTLSKIRFRDYSYPLMGFYKDEYGDLISKCFSCETGYGPWPKND